MVGGLPPDEKAGEGQDYQPYLGDGLHRLQAHGSLRNLQRRISFTKALAVEVGQYGIRVNAIGPGFTDSESSRSLIDDIANHDVRLTPLGRLEVPET
jgi:hypothetical protein